MKIVKRVLLVLACIFVVIQFVRPTKNEPSGSPVKDINSAFDVPQDVQNILRTSCYDCHSNATKYPWYAEVQPIGWWLGGHIVDAKKELNFSEFGNYRPRRQYRKFEEMIDQVKEDAMPLPSYLIIHTDAKLLLEQKEKLIGWVNTTRDSMMAQYPADSLVRRQ